MTKKHKIEKISVVDQIGDALKAKIIAGEWKPGDKLPSESDIADLYGVNRLSVRMALQKLITLGIIETRSGEGSFVREFSFAPVLNEMADFINYGNRMKDIAEIRYLIERACALKAAEICDEESGATLADICETYCRAFDTFNANPSPENSSKFVDADFALHAQIVQMSGNKLFGEIYEMVQNLIRLHIIRMINIRIQNEDTDSMDYKNLHVSLCEAIVNHDRVQTKAALTILLDVESIDEKMFE